MHFLSYFLNFYIFFFFNFFFFALSLYQHLLFTDTVPGGGAWPWWSRQEVETHTCQHECPAGQHARTHMRTHRPRGHTCNVTFHSRCNYSPNSGPRNIYFFSPRSVSLLVLFFCFFLSKCWWFVHEFLSWGDWVTHLLKSLKAFNILREHAEFFPLRFYH